MEHDLRANHQEDMEQDCTLNHQEHEPQIKSSPNDKVT